MGLSPDRVRLSAATAGDAASNKCAYLCADRWRFRLTVTYGQMPLKTRA